MPTVQDVDRIVSAEIPSKDIDPELYLLVQEFMLHGPCGLANQSSPCMTDGNCSKNFPRKFNDRTSLDADGYPLYMRLDTGKYVEKNGAKLDNRYISACEATWRIFSFDIHYRNPAVERLSFHLKGEQQVVYEGESDLNTVLAKPTIGFSMFLSWMKCNKIHKEARELTYVEFPIKFVWDNSKREWRRRKKGFAVGRIHHVPPSVGEGYYLRILLNTVRRPTSFEAIRTVNNILYPTYKDACYALGLLEDEAEYVEVLQEASYWGTGHYLRYLFVMILLSHSVSRPALLWEKNMAIAFR